MVGKSAETCNLQEGASLGIVPCVSFKENPIVVDANKLQIHVAEVSFCLGNFSAAYVVFVVIEIS